MDIKSVVVGRGVSVDHSIPKNRITGYQLYMTPLLVINLSKFGYPLSERGHSVAGKIVR